MALEDYEELATDPLVFPYRGKRYTLPPLSMADGIELALSVEDPEHRLNKLNGRDLYKFALGTLWDEFLADDVESGFLVRAGMTALAEHRNGRAVAEIIWKTGGDPKAIQALTGTTPSEPDPGTTSTSTGAESTTPAPAPGNGTKRRKK